MSRVLVLGATGTIGRATTAALLSRGHDVVCVVRAAPGDLPAGAIVRTGDLTDPASLAANGIRGERFDALVSCLASRTGVPADAWAIDYKANATALAAAKTAGITQMVLLSAICVQKPRLAFQHAKLAFEAELKASGVAWSIVRPTAFFKSLSGQVERVRRGKPFLVFGDGRLTACKPIGDRDLARFLIDCIDDPARRGCILPIGGPGPALTPLDQAEALFSLLGIGPRIRRVPVAVIDAVVATLGGLAALRPSLADKAEFARIGRYYATESMLVRDEATGRYDADATPSTGDETLFDHYARLVRGEAEHVRGAQSVF